MLGGSNTSKDILFDAEKQKIAKLKHYKGRKPFRCLVPPHRAIFGIVFALVVFENET